jgi:hypothetical protein
VYLVGGVVAMVGLVIALPILRLPSKESASADAAKARAAPEAGLLVP